MKTKTMMVAAILVGRVALNAPLAAAGAAADSARPLADAGRIGEIMAKMSLREKIGQCVQIQLSKIPLGSPEETAAWFAKYPVGSVFMGRDLASLTEGKLGNADSLARCAAATKIPLTVAGDLGPVTSPTPLPNGGALGAMGDPAVAREYGRLVGRIGRANGFNWVLAPCVDISVNWMNPIMACRTMGDDAEKIAALATEIAVGMQEEGLSACGKHYPGDGVDHRDQHLGPSVNDMSKEEWMATFGKVYGALSASGCHSVMIGHISLPFADPPQGKYGLPPPAVMSAPISTDLLRDGVGFKGVAITDALMMGGFVIYKFEREERRYMEAFKAGADVLLWPSLGVIDLMEEAVANGEISVERIDASVRRILEMKEKEGVLDGGFVPPKGPSKELLAEAEAFSRRIAEREVTLVRNDAGILPLDASKTKKVLLWIADGSGKKTERSYDAMKRGFGKRGAEVTVAINGNCLDLWKREAAGERYDAVFFLYAGGMHAVKNAMRPVGGAGECLWTMINTDFHKPIAISFAWPYLLQDAPWLETLVNVHNGWNSDVAQETVVRLLYGEIPFRGKSPFDLSVDLGVRSKKYEVRSTKCGMVDAPVAKRSGCPSAEREPCEARSQEAARVALNAPLVAAIGHGDEASSLVAEAEAAGGRSSSTAAARGDARPPVAGGGALGATRPTGGAAVSSKPPYLAGGGGLGTSRPTNAADSARPLADAMNAALAPWNGEVANVATSNGVTAIDYALRPTPKSLIRCQLLLPPKEQWTGRLWGQGNSGAAGGKPRAMAAFARTGDAVAHTDLGTSGDRAFGEPEVWTDFAHRATHLMTLSAKTLVKAHYGKAPVRSYFYGASTGGCQGLMEAERYPEDYDGVLAIVPAFARVPYHAKYVWNARQMFNPDGSRAVSDAQVAAVESAALDWFAAKEDPHAKDGGYMTRVFWTAEDMDGVLSLAAEREPSLAAPALRARFRAVWDGPVFNGRRAGLGLPPGARLSSWLGGKYTCRESWLWNWLAGERRRLETITDDEMEEWCAGLARRFNATNPDLSRFFACGGVVLMTSGAEDDICEPAPHIAFAESVAAAVGEDASKAHFRLYLNPGRAHGSKHRGLCDLENMWSALVEWREKGEAPDVMLGVFDWSEKGFPDDVYGGKSRDPRRIPVAPWPDKMSGSDAKGWRRVRDDPPPAARAIDPIYWGWEEYEVRSKK